MRHNNGEGTIVQRPNGTYAAALRCNGVRRWVYGKTEKEVRRKLAELQRQATRQGQLPDPGKRNVNDLLDAWLEAASATLKPRTTETYRQLCDDHIRPKIGGMRLSRLTPDVVQRLIAPLQREGKTRTAQKVYRALHRACALAVLWGWLPSNPCDRIVKPRHTYGQREVWTQEELGRFLEGAREHPLYPLYLLLVSTGLRLGEALALRWNALDLAAGTLEVRQSVQRIRGEWVFSAPKSRAGIRVISIPREVVHELRRYRARQIEQRGPAAWAADGLVFCNREGGPLNPSVAEHGLKRLCQRLDITVVTPHGLRHLHASLLLSEGLPIPDVSRRLGHASPAITMTTYAHVVGRQEDAAVQAISKVIAGKNG